MTNSSNIQYNEKVPAIPNWSDTARLKFMQTLNDQEEECKTSMGLSEN